MPPIRALIYDLEIKRAIPDKRGASIPGIEYCAGWHDHAAMGISTLCAYDCFEERYRVFCDDNKEEFFQLAKDRLLVGYNSISFDNAVLRACWDFVTPEREDFCYDILQQIWIAAGLAPEFRYPTHIGFGLDDVYRATFNESGKTGHGALAPVMWQRGEIGAVIDYCLQDVKLTLRLFKLILEGGALVNPKVMGGLLRLRMPQMPGEQHG